MKITVRKVLTADATNILSGTELASIPDYGELEILVASSANDTLLTIFRPGGELLIFQRPVIQRTGGMPDALADTPYEMIVTAGEAPRVDVDIQTAGTVVAEITWESPD